VEDPIPKIIKAKNKNPPNWQAAMVQGVKGLPSKGKALSSTPSTAKNKQTTTKILCLLELFHFTWNRKKK
jgi:hypothetical protein